MFRNNYDNDAITYSPTGHLFQVEYALEAIKQGSPTVGIISKDHVVLVSLKRNVEDLGSYQKKIIKLDDNIGLSLSGLAPDSRELSKFLRSKVMESKLLFNRKLQIEKASLMLGEKAHQKTQYYGLRPYGVGLLIAGYDETGSHLFELLPFGNVLEYTCTAIGARSQAAKTYLEHNLESIKLVESINDLVLHGLKALRDTLSLDKELNFKNTTVALVGKDFDFKIYDNEDVQVWLDKLDYVSNKRKNNDTSEKIDDYEDKMVTD